MFIPQEILEEVGFLSVDQPTATGVQRYEIGTCFFVTVFNHSRNVGYGYLITAKHVVEPYIGSATTIFVRLNKHTVEPGKPGVKYFGLPNDWYIHDDPSVDLAVLPWASIENNYVCSSFSFDEILTTPQFMYDNGGVWPPRAGEPVLFVGLMTQHVGLDRNLPVARHGHIALVTTEKINGEYGPSDYHLIDLQAYPGHSGGPVWVAFGQTLFLLGSLVAGFPDLQEVLVTPRTNNGKAKIVQHFSLGISLVTPVEKIKDILLSPTLEQKRQNDEPTPIKPTPVPSAPFP